MASLPQSAARTPAWRLKLMAFWRWWTGQLGLLVPEQFAAMGGAGRVPQVAVEGDSVVLVEPRGAAEGARRVSLEGDPNRGRAALRSLLEKAGERRGRVRIVLGHGDALVRRATMPAATEENLSQVLAFEMDRLTPFRADEVYHDHRVLSRDNASATLQVLLAVARRDLVDRQVQVLRSLGATVAGVTVREDAAAAVALNLIPHEQRGERETSKERLAKRAMLGVVGVLLLAVLLYPAWAKREQIKALHPVEAKAQSDAQAVDRLAQELDRLVAEHNFLLTKKHANPPVLAYIEEITRLLPDNTWVQQLDLKVAGKSRELQIQGETTSSSRLIEILEQSTLLQNAATRGTVTRGSQPGTERFAIAAEAKPRPMPQTVAVSELATPVAPGAPPAPANASGQQAAPAGGGRPPGTPAPSAPAASQAAAPPQPVPQTGLGAPVGTPAPGQRQKYELLQPANPARIEVEPPKPAPRKSP